MYRFAESSYVFRVNARGNAMAEIEHMAITAAEVAKNTGDGLFDLCRFCVEHGWIEIALQGNPVTNLLPGLTKRCCPVAAQRITTAVCDISEPLTSTLGEEDEGNRTCLLYTSPSPRDRG